MIYLVALSGKAESGKDTFAGKAVEVVKSFAKLNGLNIETYRYAFAGALKDYCKEKYNWNGIKDTYGRGLLQRVGEEKRKENENVWVDSLLIKMYNELNTSKGGNAVVFITDMRYPNEKAGIERLRFTEVENYGSILPVTVRISRKSYSNRLTDTQRNHESECLLDNEWFDYLVVNSSLEDYELAVETIMLDILGRGVFE